MDEGIKNESRKIKHVKPLEFLFGSNPSKGIIKPLPACCCDESVCSQCDEGTYTETNTDNSTCYVASDTDICALEGNLQVKTKFEVCGIFDLSLIA